MQFPLRAQAIVDALFAQHEPLAKGTEDDRRALTLMMAQQLCFELGPHWGTKSSSPTNPQSKDALAFRDDVGFLVCFDWQNGGDREVIRFPTALEIPGQHFIAVFPINHLDVLEIEPPQPLPPAHATELWDFRVKVEALFLELFTKLDAQHKELLAVAKRTVPQSAKSAKNRGL